jgi:beta-phosphoglucomutase-like phosphatase (HAD superfamily)
VLLIYRLGEYFRGFVSGEDVRKSKPAPDIFLKTASLAGLDPSRCLVIEDSVNGIRAARAAGMKVIALRHPDIDSPPLCEASLVVDSLMEINPGLIRRLLR